MKRPTPNEIPSEENEDEDDGYLDPNDLEIIDDENSIDETEWCR